MELYRISLNVYIASLVFPMIILLLNRQPIAYRWLAVCLALSFLTEIVAKVLLYYKINPNIAGSIYTLIGTLAISCFFYHAINWRELKRPLIVVNVFYVLFGLFNLLIIQKTSHNSYSTILQSIIILLLSITFFYRFLRELPTLQVQRHPMFWIVSGFFFSYSGNIVIYTSSHYLIHTLGSNMIVVWTLHNFLNVIGSVLFTFGAYLSYKSAKMPKSQQRVAQ